MRSSAARKAAATRKRKPAATQTSATGKRRAIGTRAASTRKLNATREAIPNNTPSVVPLISYEDGTAALVWIRRAIGFRETARHTTPDGRLSHGEMKAGDGFDHACVADTGVPKPEAAPRGV